MARVKSKTERREDVGTPKWLYDQLNRVYRFDLDAAASPENAKCKKFYTIEDDAFSQEWSGNVFLNPPWGRDLKKWHQYAYAQVRQSANVVVCLVPASVSSVYWKENVVNRASEVVFVVGRVNFEGYSGSPMNDVSLVVYWSPKVIWIPTRYLWWDAKNEAPFPGITGSQSEIVSAGYQIVAP